MQKVNDFMQLINHRQPVSPVSDALYYFYHMTKFQVQNYAVGSRTTRYYFTISCKHQRQTIMKCDSPVFLQFFPRNTDGGECVFEKTYFFFLAV